MKNLTRYSIGFAIILITALAVWQGTIYLEGTAPVITPQTDINYVGSKTTLSVSFSDEGRGLKQILAYIEQDERKQLLGGMNFPTPGEARRTLNLDFDQPQLDLKEGPARLIFSAVDHSLRKNESSLVHDVVVDRTPPRISTLTSAHYINPGGSCLVVYQLSEPAEETGVLVNDTFFRGYPFDDDQQRPRYAVLFGIPVDSTRDTVKMGITARDRAGNEAFSTFPHHIRSAAFRNRTLTLSDNFLDNNMPEFQSVVPRLRNASPIQAFIYVNEVMRDENDRKVEEICSRSEPRKLWEGRFLRMPGSTMAGFGDFRTYTYNGEPVTTSLHEGVDLASTINAAVEASNSGIVAYAGYLGIYGNMVIIDHGLGLFSQYAHLSSISVGEGEHVNKGDLIGRTGVTGLAGGDHLHFAIYLGSQFVNPLEWWDQGWIDANILGKASLP